MKKRMDTDKCAGALMGVILQEIDGCIEEFFDFIDQGKSIEEAAVLLKENTQKQLDKRALPYPEKSGLEI